MAGALLAPRRQWLAALAGCTAASLLALRDPGYTVLAVYTAAVAAVAPHALLRLSPGAVAAVLLALLVHVNAERHAPALAAGLAGLGMGVDTWHTYLALVLLAAAPMASAAASVSACLADGRRRALAYLAGAVAVSAAGMVPGAGSAVALPAYLAASSLLLGRCASR
ncbi:hypothetical protein [Pyrodictium abyssi]|uniref:Uncharacterized protein n=1 Tax=Pyrodictium abyssi TaxID=54256 RepID=A0ABN6ZPV6_9CREN|nr:hypothetical protein PABY_00220 [Pyrodictium abyssi]